jgi:anti-sigma factor RsiW
MEHPGCRNLLGSLSEFVDGTLEDELCAEIQRHMDGCDNCRVVVDSLRKTIYLYRLRKNLRPYPRIRSGFQAPDLDGFLENKELKPVYRTCLSTR